MDRVDVIDFISKYERFLISKLPNTPEVMWQMVTTKYFFTIHAVVPDSLKTYSSMRLINLREIDIVEYSDKDFFIRVKHVDIDSNVFIRRYYSNSSIPEVLESGCSDH